MRRLFTCFLLAGLPLLAQSSEEKDVLAVVQKVFDGMAAHDGAMIRATLLPNARLYAAHDQAPPSDSAMDNFAAQIQTMAGKLLERFTGKPAVEMYGRMAIVTGDYDFFRDDKFGHCGVDSFSLLKTADGWKIAAITYTAQTTGCKGH